MIFIRAPFPRDTASFSPLLRLAYTFLLVINFSRQAVVLEGKYWKRKLAAVTAEYKKWRMFYRNKILGWTNKDGTEVVRIFLLFYVSFLFKKNFTRFDTRGIVKVWIVCRWNRWTR